jgi:hypothetical protein
VQAARDGKPMPLGAVLVLEQHAAKLDAERKPVTGADGFYVADRFVAFTVMGTGPGWGERSRRCCATATGTTPPSAPT